MAPDLLPVVDGGLGNTSWLADLGRGRTAVMCGHGERAMTAASLLGRAGHDGLLEVVGGPDEWAESTGEELGRS